MKNRHFNGSSRDIIEEEQSREYETHVMGLRNSVTAIKEVSNAIKNCSINDVKNWRNENLPETEYCKRNKLPKIFRPEPKLKAA